MSTASNALSSTECQDSSRIAAASIGQVAASRLEAAPRVGRVHSVYEGAINIRSLGGIVSLVPERPERSGRGPINVTLRLHDQISLSSFRLQPGDSVERSNSILNIGEGRLLVSLKHTTLYTPLRRFPDPMLGSRHIRWNYEVAREAVLVFGHLGGLGGLIPLVREKGMTPSDEHLNLFAAAALTRILFLLEAIRGSDGKAIRSAARELAGLGPGLTPSSDDLLSGLMLVMYLHAINTKRNEERVTRITRAIVSGTRGRTTLLSQEYIAQAACGSASERVMRLCRELLTGKPESVRREVRQVVMIGETSGTDTILGILLGTQLLTSWRGA